jgi:CsgH protein
MPYQRLTATKPKALTALCASLAWLSQTGVSAISLPAANPTSAGCQIRASILPSGLRLEAVADAQAPIAGEYKLTVAKDSESGSSRNVQSGAFQADAGQQQVLATIILDRSAVGHYSATLSLEWDDGHESCSSP